MIPRSALVLVGPLVGVSTVLASTRGTEAPPWFVLGLAVVAGGGLWVAGEGGRDGSLACGLAAVGTAAGSSVAGRGLVPEIVVWAAGAVAAGEAVGLARRSRSVARPDAAVVNAEVTSSAALVMATLLGGLVLLGAGTLPGPGGLVGEVLALVALIGLGALLAATRGGRAAVRHLVTRQGLRSAPDPRPPRS